MAARTPGSGSFDRLARIYQPLERLAFGRDLERARFCFLDELRDCRSILLLGEGDGRSLARLTRLAPRAEFHCIDGSARMLRRAAARLDEAPDVSRRVRFEQADILNTPLEAERYDGITTFFFLDCF